MTKIVPPPAAGRFRRRILVASIGVLLVIGAGWGLLGRHAAPPEPASAPIPAATPPQTASETPPQTPPETPSEASAQATAPAAAPAPAAEAAPAAPEPPPLTAVQVAERPVHEVPPDKDPPKPDSVALDLSRPPPGVAGRHPSEGSTTSAPKQFAGAARVTGATSLMVGAVPVQLFGVKPPLPGDRCEQGGVSTSCVDLAKKRLLERLAASDQVNCRTPNPQPGLVVAFAICLDPRGIDLGSYLLNEGLALADTGQSYDYVGAEGVAKTLKHGLWKFR
ncbi:hypothetical protein GCM10011611_64080 [Aliidongia dinghuensis]|uniref:Thermonuclease family protein n=1 Tax=Aliidongia dinghuensis TaxID=1867774 RepID=A0A8J2Z0V6_9PROT|nr:hypothetical protein [Aliidongia dinghuensis]GGF48882.1 hypothetical protein GCM10011611_64080 [Aliidongia dinghuensis]